MRRRVRVCWGHHEWQIRKIVLRKIDRCCVRQIKIDKYRSLSDLVWRGGFNFVLRGEGNVMQTNREGEEHT